MSRRSFDTVMGRWPLFCMGPAAFHAIDPERLQLSDDAVQLFHQGWDGLDGHRVSDSLAIVRLGVLGVRNRGDRLLEA